MKEWLDRFDKRALVLAGLPVLLFVILVLRCLLPPGLGLKATIPFMGILLLSYAPLTYLALFRAWAGGWIRVETGGRHPFWSHVGPTGLFVIFTFWVWNLHDGLINHAKDEIAPKEGLFGLIPFTGDPPPTGLDLFGPTLVAMGILVPVFSVGVLWILLPREP